VLILCTSKTLKSVAQQLINIMLKQITFLILALHAKPLCVNRNNELKESWKPFEGMEFEPFHKINKLYNKALETAFDELQKITFNKTNVLYEGIGGEILEANLDSHFAMRDSVRKDVLIKNSVKIYQMLGDDYIKNKRFDELTCSSILTGQLEVAMVVGYGNYLQEEGHFNEENNATQQELVDLTNKVLQECTSIDEFLGFDFKRRLSKFPSYNRILSSRRQMDKIFNYFVLGYDVLNLLSNPKLKLPEKSLEFVAWIFWYYREYDFPYAYEYDWKKVFDDNSFVVTHWGYLLSGQGRYKIFRKDSPLVYNYVRDNFYDAIQYGDMDLVSEFIDILREYGCNQQNDQQIRHGLSWLMTRYRKNSAGQFTWLQGNEEIVYDRLHVVWTVIGALKDHVFKSPRTNDLFYQNIQAAIKMSSDWKTISMN